jgi:hypothetical protein
MEHRVEENRSDEQRISIAFNIALMTNSSHQRQPGDRLEL